MLKAFLEIHSSTGGGYYHITAIEAATLEELFLRALAAFSAAPDRVRGEPLTAYTNISLEIHKEAEE